MANNRKGGTFEERLERSCALKIDTIRGLIRGQESAEDRALCANWLKFLSRAAKHEARARDCLLEQMVRQLRELGHLSLPFTTQANCRTELRLLLDEEGRQRLRRLSPPVVIAPQPSRTSIRSRSKRSSPFVWRQRVQHLNTLEKQYRREEQELWRNEFSLSSQPKEGAEIKEIGVQVDMPLLSPREERDLLERARKQQAIKERRERERLERQKRDLEYGRQRAMLAEQRHSDRQRREEARQLRERRLLEQKRKVKERRDHERKLLDKKREARQSPLQELGSMARAHRQQQDEVKEELVVKRDATKVHFEEPREVKKLKQVQEARKQVRCETCDTDLPPDTNCVRCEVREQQSLLRAENVKQKVMSYEQLKMYHRERAQAERARLMKEQSDREKEKRRREIEQTQRRSHKGLPNGRKLPDDQEIDALEVSKREMFEMYERTRLKKAQLDRDKEEQRRKIEEAERWCLKELEKLRKLREDQKTNEKRDSMNRKVPKEFKKTKKEIDSKGKASGQRVEGGKEEESADKENEAREQSEQKPKNDLQRKAQEQHGKKREVEERDIDDSEEEDSYLREKKLLQKWDELQEMYKKPAGEPSHTKEIQLRENEIRARKKFLRETSEHTEEIRNQIREVLESRKKLKQGKLENEEELLEKPIEQELITERKAKMSATKQQEHRNKITGHLDLHQNEEPQRFAEDQRVEQGLRKEKKEKQLEKPIEKNRINERKAKESATNQQEQRKKITGHLDLHQNEEPQRLANEQRLEESFRKENEEKLLDKPIEKEIMKKRKEKESPAKQEGTRKKITAPLDLRQSEELQLEGMSRATEVKDQFVREDKKTENHVKKTRKTKDGTEKGIVEEQPPGDRKSEQADKMMGLLRAREEFLTKLEQMSLEKKPKPDHIPLDNVQSRLKKFKEEKDQLTKQIRDRCQVLQKERLAKGEAGSEPVDVPQHQAQQRDLGSHSWKMAQANWLHADIIKEKCLQELEIIEAALQKKNNVGEDAESPTLLEPYESPGKSSLASKDQPIQAKASGKKPKNPEPPTKRWVRFKDNEEGSEEEVTYRSSKDLVPLHSMIGKTCLRKENPKSPCVGAQDQRYTGACGVTYCTQSGRKRFPRISQHRVSPRKENVLQRRIFSQLLTGSRPTEFNPKILIADNRILKRKLSVGKSIALNKHIQKTLMLRASRMIDRMLMDKAKARPNIKSPRLIFQTLIDPLLQGNQNISRKLLETINLLDGELEEYLGDLCNSTFDKQQQEQQAGPDWRGLPRDEHLVSDLFNDFRNLDPKLNKTLKRIDHLYNIWKDQRLKLQKDFN